MKERKAGRGTRQAAQGASGVAHARAETSEPRVTGLEHGGEIRLTQLLRALTGWPVSRIKSAH